MTTIETRSVTSWQDEVTTSVLSAGSGPALVFLHGEGGHEWGPFLDALATSHTVYAPMHPGTDGEHPDAIHSLDDVHDLVVYYAELFDRLGLGPVVLVGHSFGGMVAAELAAAFPERVSRLVLIDPFGLWSDAAPTAPWLSLEMSVLLAATYSDPTGPAASSHRALLTHLGDDPERAANHIWSLGCTAKFAWPIPDRGLSKRAHRISSPTLIVWGRDDGIVPVALASEFVRRIPGARLEVVDGAAHMPHVEQPDVVSPMVTAFTAGG